MKALVWRMIGFEQLPKPRKGPEMKDSKESMDIIEAYDLFGSYNGAAKYVGCSPNTVKKFVQARSAGQLIRQGKYERRPKATDKYVAVIEEAVDRSKARVRANQIHLRLVALGYSGSMRSTRRAVAKAKVAWRKATIRIYWPWSSEIGKWAQYDFSDGPVIDGKKTTLFHFYLPFSKVRIVKPIPDQSLPNVIMALDYCFRYIGGVPAYVLTDNAKTAAVKHIAGVAVINPKMVSFASAYGFSIQTCVVYDPASKGGVEAAVRVAKEDICPKDTNLVQNYTDVAELEAACDAYTTSINSVVHSTSGKIPSVVLKSEAMTFHGLPKVPYLAAYGVMRKVEPNMPIVRFNHCGYSVPAKYRREVVYVRSVLDEIVIVAQDKAGGYVSEIARHRRGEAFSYVIDDAHKEKDHPSGPLTRMPIPTNEIQAKFLSITPDASQWLIRACNSGASGIESSIADLVRYADKGNSSSVISESLRLGAFNHSTISDLISIDKRSSVDGTKTTSQRSSKPQGSNGVSSSPQGPYGASTDSWSALKAVS